MAAPPRRASYGGMSGAPSGLSFASGSPRANAVGRLERGQVNDIQRARLLSAAGLAACEQGAANVTVAQIVERAGVSRRTFYEIFGDAEQCLLAALRDALARAVDRVSPAWRAQGGWCERLRNALAELLCLFDEEPVTGRLLVVESLAAGHRMLGERSRVLDGLIQALHEDLPPARTGVGPAGARSAAGGGGAGPARRGDGPVRVEVEGAVGGALSVLHTRLTEYATGRPAGFSGPLSELTGPLMSMLVLPYMGPAAARREMARPAPSRKPRETHDGGVPPRKDPFKEAGMRLTYRTMRVLDAIARHPGASNRQVADLAELNDQGQTSKLLGRLERLGLIVNKGHGQSRGEPNAWTFTPVGLKLTNSIRLHTQGHHTGPGPAASGEPADGPRDRRPQPRPERGRS